MGCSVFRLSRRDWQTSYFTRFGISAQQAAIEARFIFFAATINIMGFTCTMKMIFHIKESDKCDYDYIFGSLFS